MSKHLGNHGYAQDDADKAQGDALVVDKYMDDLRSGRTLALAAASHRSRFGYKPPTSYRQWSHAITTLGHMARESDAMAQIASHIVGRINLYGDDAQLCAAIYDGAFEAVHKGYTDVVGLAGPEPGRRSDRQRRYTLGEMVNLAYWLILACKGATSSVDGPGWCLSAIAEMVGGSPWYVREAMKLSV